LLRYALLLLMRGKSIYVGRIRKDFTTIGRILAELVFYFCFWQNTNGYRCVALSVTPAVWVQVTTSSRIRKECFRNQTVLHFIFFVEGT
jgi:hypothetical protein